MEHRLQEQVVVVEEATQAVLLEDLAEEELEVHQEVVQVV